MAFHLFLNFWLSTFIITILAIEENGNNSKCEEKIDSSILIDESSEHDKVRRQDFGIPHLFYLKLRFILLTHYNCETFIITS